MMMYRCVFLNVGMVFGWMFVISGMLKIDVVIFLLMCILLYFCGLLCIWINIGGKIFGMLVEVMSML